MKENEKKRQALAIALWDMDDVSSFYAHAAGDCQMCCLPGGNVLSAGADGEIKMYVNGAATLFLRTFVRVWLVHLACMLDAVLSTNPASPMRLTRPCVYRFLYTLPICSGMTPLVRRLRVYSPTRSPSLLWLCRKR